MNLKFSLSTTDHSWSAVVFNQVIIFFFGKQEVGRLGMTEERWDLHQAHPLHLQWRFHQLFETKEGQSLATRPQDLL